MAGKSGTAPSTYSPSPTTQKTKIRIFKDDDVDWVRPDERGFHQCRPACKLPFCSLDTICLVQGVLTFIPFVASKNFGIFFARVSEFDHSRLNMVLVSAHSKVVISLLKCSFCFLVTLSYMYKYTEVIEFPLYLFW